MKITKIKGNFNDHDDTDGKRLHAAIMAARTPFGSLTEGVELAAIAYLAVPPREAVQKVTEILRIVWGANTTERASVEFGEWEVTFITSGTRIRIYRCAGGHTVEVGFGEMGSAERALAILSVAERMEEDLFTAYARERQLSRREVLDALLGRAEERRRSWEEGREGFYPSERIAAEHAAAEDEELLWWEKLDDLDHRADPAA